jgi:hypothetical protein
MNHRILFSGVVLVALFALARSADAREPRSFRLVSSSDGPLDDLRDLGRWDDLPEDRRRQLGRAHERLERMPPERRTRLLDHLDRLERMPPAARARMMQNWQRWRDLPSDEREKLRRRWRDMNRGEPHDPWRSPDR